MSVRRTVRRLTSLAFAVGLSLIASAASGGSEPVPRLLRPVGGEALRTGQLVEIAWEAMPDEAEECELLLVVGGPGGSKLRLTRQLDPGAGRWTWRVPALPIETVTLEIRWGDDQGREFRGGSTPPFRVLSQPGVLPADVVFQAGEWWLGESSPPIAARIDAADPGTIERGGAPEEELSPATGGNDRFARDRRQPFDFSSRNASRPASRPESQYAFADQPLTFPRRE
jgi:hypothetical protein